MRTLLEDGILKAAQSRTTLEDVVRVVATDDAAAHKEEATKPEASRSPSTRGHSEEPDKSAGQPLSGGVMREAELGPHGVPPPMAGGMGKSNDSQAKERVLVVEDSTTIASVVKYFLELEGFEVLVAKDGISGLEAARRDPMDVIVTDYNMPGMDGMAMVKALRADAATRGIAVLMLTSASRKKRKRSRLGSMTTS